MWMDGFDCKGDTRFWVSFPILLVQNKDFYAYSLHSVNCRLPQTPRSPSAVASHYFDDIFTRSARPRSSGRPSIRRSSTSRSIGNRSDFGSTFNGETPEAPPADGEESDRRNEHVSNYVESQMERVRRRASVGTYEDELETQADHAGGQ